MGAAPAQCIIVTLSTTEHPGILRTRCKTIAASSSLLFAGLNPINISVIVQVDDLDLGPPGGARDGGAAFRGA
jgi:hypothetical protein